MPVRTDSGGGGGETQGNLTERRTPFFLGGLSRGAFGQPAFFLAGNHMTIRAAFQKEVSLKA